MKTKKHCERDWDRNHHKVQMANSRFKHLYPRRHLTENENVAANCQAAILQSAMNETYRQVAKENDWK